MLLKNVIHYFVKVCKKDTQLYLKHLFEQNNFSFTLYFLPFKNVIKEEYLEFKGISEYDFFLSFLFQSVAEIHTRKHGIMSYTEMT